MGIRHSHDYCDSNLHSGVSVSDSDLAGLAPREFNLL